jgi:hypothetical protein
VVEFRGERCTANTRDSVDRQLTTVRVGCRARANLVRTRCLPACTSGEPNDQVAGHGNQHGSTRRTDTKRTDTNRHDTTRLDTTNRHETKRHETTRHDTARHDTTRRDETSTTRHTDGASRNDCLFSWQRRNPRQSSNERPPKGEGEGTMRSHKDRERDRSKCCCCR